MKHLNLTMLLAVLMSMGGTDVAANDILKSNDGIESANVRMISVWKTVVDTLKAEEIFKKKKEPALLTALQQLKASKQRCDEICTKKIKKVSAPEDLELLNHAYDVYMQYNPPYRTETKSVPVGFLFFGNIQLGEKVTDMNGVELTDKHVKKGKVAKEVNTYLTFYSSYLEDRILDATRKIALGWTEWLKEDEIPYKEIETTILNPNYRGLHYADSEKLDMIDEQQQRRGWEFLQTTRPNYHHDIYPQEIDYVTYDSKPGIKVMYRKDENHFGNVFDDKGELKCYLGLFRKDKGDEFQDIRRLVYLKDYENNKYNVQSLSKVNQDYLKKKLHNLSVFKKNEAESASAEAWGALLGAAFAGQMANEFMMPGEAYRANQRAKRNALTRIMDSKEKRDAHKEGSKFIMQLDKDHEDDLGYIYMIERISDVSFRVVYVDKITLQPSYCAEITYSTGEKPYTTKFSTKLVDIPSGIPPIK